MQIAPDEILPKPATTQLIVIRHGETAWNSQGIQQGHSDNPLNELGMRQAKAIANRLKDVQFDALYSSDLKRAVQTVNAISARTVHKVQFDARLRERDLGIFEGLTKAQVKAKYPDVFEGYASGGIDFIIPDGESTRQRYDRSIAALTEIASNHSGQTVVVVTHGGVLNGLLRCCLNIPLDVQRNFAVFNASFNLFSFEDARWKLLTWGDVSHLGGMCSIDDP